MLLPRGWPRKWFDAKERRNRERPCDAARPSRPEGEPVNTDTQNALDALTRPWTDVLSPRESGTGKYVPIDYEPLLDMLKQAIGSSLGRTSAGRSPDAERSLLNLKAFQLWEHIDGTVRAWWREVSKEKCPDELKDALNRLSGILDALHASHQIETARFEHITAQFPRWQQRIWELFDPPITKELIGACPECGVTEHVAADGGRTSNLVTYYWKGLDPEAKCQNPECGARWRGEFELINLGRILGADMDVDTLREMGLAV